MGLDCDICFCSLQYQARALQDGVKLMPGEPWTTICWQKKMQSHVLGKMLNEKKFKGGFVPMYGPVPVEYCLPEDLVCPGSIFEVTEVDAEVVKPTKRQTTDEGEASPKKRTKTSAKGGYCYSQLLQFKTGLLSELYCQSTMAKTLYLFPLCF